MQYNIGLVISVYDKIEDLEICVELAKVAGFSSILVVAEDEDKSKEALKQFNSAPIKFVKSCEYLPSDKNKFEFFKHVTCRVWQAQRLGLKELSNKTDFVVHTHADGWILDGQKIKHIVDHLNKNELDFAYRGMGITFRNFPGSPTGTIDDHFYVVRSSVIRNSLFMSKPLVDYIPGYFNIHGILSSWLISEIGISNSWHYDDTKSWQNWDDSPRNYVSGNPLRPCVYNEKFALLHCHIDDFPSKIGRAIQARYLNKHSLGLKSKLLNAFINANLDDKSINSIQLRNETNLKLLKKIFDRDDYHKNVVVTSAKVRQFKKRPFKTLTRNLIKMIYRNTLKKVLSKREFNIYPVLLNELYSDSSKVQFKLEEDVRKYKAFVRTK